MSIEDAIYTRLSGHAGLTAIIGVRHYPVIAPQNPVAPYVVWRRSGTNKISLLSVDTDISQVEYQFECYATTFEVARSIVNELRLALQRYSATVSGTVIMDITIENDEDDYDDMENLFYSSFQVTITHRE